MMMMMMKKVKGGRAPQLLAERGVRGEAGEKWGQEVLRNGLSALSDTF